MDSQGQVGVGGGGLFTDAHIAAGHPALFLLPDCFHFFFACAVCRAHSRPCTRFWEYLYMCPDLWTPGRPGQSATVQAWLRNARPAGDLRAWQGSVWTDLGLLISPGSGSLPFPEEPLNTRSKLPAGLVIDVQSQNYIYL